MKCSNYLCKNDLTEYEIKRLIVNNRKHKSKYSFCKRCRTNASAITMLRCISCGNGFSPPNTIYKSYCKPCLQKSRETIRLNIHKKFYAKPAKRLNRQIRNQANYLKRKELIQ